MLWILGFQILSKLFQNQIYNKGSRSSNLGSRNLNPAGKSHYYPLFKHSRNINYMLRILLLRNEAEPRGHKHSVFCILFLPWPAQQIFALEEMRDGTSERSPWNIQQPKGPQMKIKRVIFAFQLMRPFILLEPKRAESSPVNDCHVHLLVRAQETPESAHCPSHSGQRRRFHQNQTSSRPDPNISRKDDVGVIV